MIQVRDIYSLTDFQRNAREHAKRLEKTGRPEVLTVNGRAKLVVLDAERFQEILDELEETRARLEEVETIIAIQEGLESIARGEGRPAREARAELRARLKGGESE